MVLRSCVSDLGITWYMAAIFEIIVKIGIFFLKMQIKRYHFFANQNQEEKIMGTLTLIVNPSFQWMSINPELVFQHRLEKKKVDDHHKAADGSDDIGGFTKLSTLSINKLPYSTNK